MKNKMQCPAYTFSNKNMQGIIMRKKGTHWNHKMKLVLHELEGKMQKNPVSGHSSGNDVWPKPDQVEAWTEERKRQRTGGQYCGGIVQSEYRSKKEQKRKNFARDILMQVAKSAAFALATVALIQGIVKVLPDSVTVSSSVGGRELPIYCVETDKKQVALSFDAAWGNEDTRRILEILKKHDVKVTFFMTGGWVESYPDDVKAILAAGD